MYTKLNVTEDLEPFAERFIMDNDRMLYRPFFEAAEKFCAANSVVLGGRVGIDLIVGKPLGKNSFYWELYCDDTFSNAKAFATELGATKSPHVSAKTVALRTDIRGREFTIFINARMVFKIYSMDKYRGLKLVDIMDPTIRAGYFTQESIKCIPEEMQLIEIYRTLYTPAKMALWGEELQHEEKLYESLVSRGQLVSKSPAARGGSEIIGAVKRADLHSLLMEKLLKQHVLVGDYALSALGLIDKPTRIQFIIGDEIENFRVACERILGDDLRLVKFKNFSVTYVRYHLNIPSDFQIAKYTLYVNDGKEQFPIADVFNSAQFEMIPWKRAGPGRIANPWVLLRFIFIDIWVLKLIAGISLDKSAALWARIGELHDRAAIVREYVRRDIAKHFQLENYMGVYVNEVVAKKKLIKELGERFPMYYPAKAGVTGAGEDLGARKDTTGDLNIMQYINNDC